jgi:hypothetical protein
MGWNYKKRIKIIPGIHLNISKNGISTTIGVRGASLNIGKSGAYLNTTIPGTGIYSRHKISPSTKFKLGEGIKGFQAEKSKIKLPEAKKPDVNDNIFSHDVEEITSQDMQGIKDTINASHTQRLVLLEDLKMIQTLNKKNQFRLSLSYWLLYGFILKSKTNQIKEDIRKQKEVIEEILAQTKNTAVHLDFEFDGEMSKYYNSLYKSFEKLAESEYTWDITSEYATDRYATRSAASATVSRKPVKFRTGYLPDIQSKTPAMIWDNANGADLYFYPNFMIVWNTREHFAIVAYNELEINFTATRFIETEKVPSDSKVIDQTWFKVNKNGSPDKRFKDNYKIPIVNYGDLDLTTKTGLHERYLFSNYELVNEFYLAFLNYQIDLIKLDYIPSIPIKE